MKKKLSWCSADDHYFEVLPLTRKPRLQLSFYLTKEDMKQLDNIVNNFIILDDKTGKKLHPDYKIKGRLSLKSVINCLEIHKKHKFRLLARLFHKLSDSFKEKSTTYFEENFENHEKTSLFFHAIYNKPVRRELYENIIEASVMTEMSQKSCLTCFIPKISLK